MSTRIVTNKTDLLPGLNRAMETPFDDARIATGKNQVFELRTQLKGDPGQAKLLADVLGLAVAAGGGSSELVSEMLNDMFKHPVMQDGKMHDVVLQVLTRDWTESLAGGYRTGTALNGSWQAGPGLEST